MSVGVLIDDRISCQNKNQLLEVQEEKSSLSFSALVGLVTRRPKISRFESLKEQHFTSLLGHEPHVKLQLGSIRCKQTERGQYLSQM